MNRSNCKIYRRFGFILPLLVLFFLTGGLPALAAGTAAGEAVSKTASMAVIYGILALISLGMIGVYFALIRKRELWAVLLYVAIFVVNTGYLALSVSKTLEEALLANRIAYLGSVFLPLCMLMIIMSGCRIRPPRIAVALLICFSILIFLLAASGGYLPLYYKEVSIVFINGVARLDKVYGPLHGLYLLYLLCYFGLMVAVIPYALAKKRISAPIHAVFLAAIVLGNIGVWLVEQLIYVEFEFLSITYILCEAFLLLLSRMQQLYAPSQPENTASLAPDGESSPAPDKLEHLQTFWPEIGTLTAREAEVLRCILENMKRRDIAEQMCVSENTIKKHTSHIFTKLGISSRSELFARIAADTYKQG